MSLLILFSSIFGNIKRIHPSFNLKFFFRYCLDKLDKGVESEEEVYAVEATEESSDVDDNVDDNVDSQESGVVVGPSHSKSIIF